MINRRRVVLFASTHKGEEEVAFRILRKLKFIHQDILLILAIRHPERSARVIDLAEEMEIGDIACRSKNDKITKIPGENTTTGQAPKPTDANFPSENDLNENEKLIEENNSKTQLTNFPKRQPQPNKIRRLMAGPERHDIFENPTLVSENQKTSSFCKQANVIWKSKTKGKTNSFLNRYVLIIYPLSLFQ